VLAIFLCVDGFQDASACFAVYPINLWCRYMFLYVSGSFANIPWIKVRIIDGTFRMRKHPESFP